MEVIVAGANIEEAIKNFKKMVERSGILKQVKIRSHFETKGQRLSRKRAVNLRRKRKMERWAA
jgi:ribosomal protein S21